MILYVNTQGCTSVTCRGTEGCSEEGRHHTHVIKHARKWNTLYGILYGITTQQHLKEKYTLALLDINWTQTIT